MKKQQFEFNGRSRYLHDMSEIHLDHSSNLWLGFKFKKEACITYEILLDKKDIEEFVRLRHTLYDHEIAWYEYFDDHVFNNKTTIKHNMPSK